MYDTSARSDQPRQPKSRAGVLAATAAVGAGLLSATPATSPPGWPVTEHHDVALADYTGTTTPTPNLWDGIEALVNASGIGDKTLADFVPANATIGDVLSPSGLSLSTQLNAAGVWDLLGLQNITVAEVLKDLGLPTSMTVDGLANAWHMANVPIDFFATPLGIPSTQTTMGLAHRFSMAHETVGDIVKMLGMRTSETLSQTMEQFNLWDANVKGNTLGGLVTLSILGVGLGSIKICTNDGSTYAISSTSTIAQIVGCLNFDGGQLSKVSVTGGNNANTGNPNVSTSTTVEQILDSNHFNTTTATTYQTSEPIGDWTIGSILNFNSSTTIQQFIDNLHVNFGVQPDTSTSIPTTPVTAPGSANGGATIVDSTQDQGSTAVPAGTLLSSLPTLGSKTIGQLMAWIGVPTSQSIASLLSNEIMVGSTPLGQSTIGNALDAMLLNPGILPGYPTTQLTMSTPLSTFFTAMGGPLGTETIDQLLHITPP